MTCKSSIFCLRIAPALLLASLLAGPAIAANAQPQIQIHANDGANALTVTTPNSGWHQVAIDDSPAFRTPVYLTRFYGKSVTINTREAGLIPGIRYFVKVDGHLQPAPLRFQDTVTPPTFATCSMLQQTWRVTGRFHVGRALSGLQWDKDHWVILPHTYLLGESLYNAEMLLRPALAAARACGDLQTLNELAQYYLIMLQQTESVADLLKRPQLTTETQQRLAGTDPAARTFSATFGTQAGEGELYNAQWMHPAALLLRVVTTLTQAERTPEMQQFAAAYTRFLLHDQIDRYLFDEHLPALGGHPVAGRVARWQQAMQGLKGRDSWDTAMSDIDLWLLASVAELLGANANDPALVPIENPELDRLRSALGTGIRFFQSKRTLLPDTRDFSGKTVGSASYFNGDYAAHSDMDFTAVDGESLPTQAQRRSLPTVSWDSSHAYRIAIFLRALYENRKATGLSFPAISDLQLVVNQYLYRVFNGDFTHPLFQNFFDGSDGWFRVSWNGAGFGYPPSRFCDSHNPMRPCLTNGATIGWGELSFVNPDLARLEHALIQLGWAQTPEAQAFRDRYYSVGNPYRITVENGQEVYGGTLYYVIAENAEAFLNPTAPQP